MLHDASDVIDLLDSSQSSGSRSPPDLADTMHDTITFEYCAVSGAADTTVTRELSFEFETDHTPSPATPASNHKRPYSTRPGGCDLSGVWCIDDDDGLPPISKHRRLEEAGDSEERNVADMSESSQSIEDIRFEACKQAEEPPSVVDAASENKAVAEDYVTTICPARSASNQHLINSYVRENISRVPPDNDETGEDDSASNSSSSSSINCASSTTNNNPLLTELTQCFHPDEAFTQELRLAELEEAVDGSDTFRTNDDIEEGLLQHIVHRSDSDGPMLVRPLPKKTKTHRTYPTKRPYQREYYDGPMPLFIVDVHRLASALCTGNKSEQKLFGQRFKTVAIYGLCTWIRAIKGAEEKHCYEVDDGTGVLTVYYAHCSKTRVRRWQSTNQTTTDVLTNRHRMSKEWYAQYRECMAILRSRTPATHDRFRTGVNVLVLGFPSWSELCKKLTITVTEMYVDDGRSRDLELAFKGNLAVMYEQRYALEDLG